MRANEPSGMQLDKEFYIEIILDSMPTAAASVKN